MYEWLKVLCISAIGYAILLITAIIIFNVKEPTEAPDLWAIILVLIVLPVASVGITALLDKKKRR